MRVDRAEFDRSDANDAVLCGFYRETLGVCSRNCEQTQVYMCRSKQNFVNVSTKQHKQSNHTQLGPSSFVCDRIRFNANTNNFARNKKVVLENHEYETTRDVHDMSGTLFNVSKQGQRSFYCAYTVSSAITSVHPRCQFSARRIRFGRKRVST